MDTRGKHQLFDGRFENWEQISDCLFVVKKGLWGILNIHSNQFVFPCLYDQFSSSNGVFLLSQKEPWGDIDDNGDIRPPKYDSLSFQDDFCLARRTSEFILENKTPVYDLFNSCGELLLGGFEEFKYVKEYGLYVFLFGARYVYRSEYDQYPDLDTSYGRYVITDKDLLAILPLENGGRYQFSKGQKVHLSSSLVRNDKSFKRKREFTYEANFPIETSVRLYPSFCNGYLLTKGFGESRAIRISDGKASPIFDAIRVIEDDLFFVLQDNKVGIIGFNGNSIVSPEYDIMTAPVNGYYLGFKFSAPNKKDSSLMFERALDRLDEIKIFLIHDIKQKPTLQLVFSQTIARYRVLMNIADGDYLFRPLETECGLKALSVKNPSVFNEDFAAEISTTPQSDMPNGFQENRTLQGNKPQKDGPLALRLKRLQEKRLMENRILQRSIHQEKETMYWFPASAVCPDSRYYIDKMLEKERELILNQNHIKHEDHFLSGRHYVEFRGSRAQEEGGYSDEDIYDAFDGIPDAYGNIE